MYGKLSRTNYFEKIAQMRTIKTPAGVITTTGGEFNFLQTVNPAREDYISVQNLDVYTIEDEAKIEPLSTKN